MYLLSRSRRAKHADALDRRADRPAPERADEVSLPNEEAAGHVGWLAPLASRDDHISSELTKQQLGLIPTGPDLLTDIDRTAYFTAR
ncbi:hypothetical protein ABZ357_33800 [Streptomyces sp. NPDC005917]|uniref:hypothetical protein n=1 Tax=unclassified Streptomyces TaxID=2593676 RepID=UPI0033E38558